MRRLLLALALCLAGCVAAFSQTTVNLSVTDTPDNQTWNNGTWQVQLIPGAGSSDQTRNFTLLSGGGSLAAQSGSLSSTGTASGILLPANVNIGPQGTRWQFTVCSQQATACSIANITVTTSSPQAVAVNPPSIRVAALPNLPPIVVYTTTEISSASIGSQITVVGTTPSTPSTQTCTVVSGSTCTTWAGLGGVAANSPSSQVLVGNNSYSAVNYGVKADAIYVLDATWTNTQNTISCTNNDCNFVAATDNGKVCWGISTAGTATMPFGTLTVTGAQAATCSTATGSAAANGTFVWGTDDTAAWLALRTAYYASQRAAFIVGPSGHTIVTKAPLRDNRGNSSLAAMWQPSFQSPDGMTVFLPTPTFDFTTCTTPSAGMNLGCFWDTAPTGATNQSNLPQYSKVQNLGVNGLGFISCGGAANTASAVAFNRVEGANIWVWNWCNGVAGFNGVSSVAPNSFYNLNIFNTGSVGLNATGAGSNTITLLLTSFIGQGASATGMTVQSGAHVISKGSYYLGCGTQCVSVAAGGFMTHDGDQLQGSSGNQYIDVFGTMYIFGNTIISATNNSGSALLTRATGKIFIKDTTVAETGTSGVAFNVNLVPGGSIINQGGVTITAGTDQTALVAANVVPSTGWGTTATVTALSGTPDSNPTRFQFQVNSSGTGQAANPTLAITYPANTITTPIWTCKQAGGTQTLAQISGENTASTTSMTLTYNGTPVAGNNVVVVCTGSLL